MSCPLTVLQMFKWQNQVHFKLAFTFSMPFTYCSKKQVSRLHQDQLTAWELGSKCLSALLCKSSLCLSLVWH